MMKSLSVICLSCLASVLSATAAVTTFPVGGWGQAKVVREGRALVVRDASGGLLLRFNTEGGDFADKLVVSQAVDRLVIDPRPAFAAGMGKLVFCSADFNPKPFLNADATLVNELGGTPGTRMLMYFEGHAAGRHYYKSREIALKGHRKSYAMVQSVPEQLNSLHLRWDVMAPARGPIEFYGAKYAPTAELPVSFEKPVVRPELLFHAPFDGTADAKTARGAAQPKRAEGLVFVEGKRGQAVRLTAAAKSVLEYAMKGNVVPERGTVSLWFKREWPDSGRTEKGGEIWRTLFANPDPRGERIGSGQLWFWWWGPNFRADQSDDDDDYRCWNGAIADDWNHLAVSWDEAGVRVYMNGRSAHGESDGVSPMSKALKTQDLLSFNRQAFETFFVGCCGKGRQFDGLIDDLRIYSAPLSNEQIRELHRRESVIEITATGLYALADTKGTITARATSPAGCDLSGLHYCLCDAKGAVVCSWKDAVSKKPVSLTVNEPAGQYTLKATDGTWYYGAVPVAVLRRDNPYLLKDESAEAARAKGAGRLANLELVSSLTLDRTPGPDRFRAVGPVQVKRLNGMPYLEAGPKAGDRFALRFNLETNAPLYCFEIDYPDNAVRTADLIIQKSASPDSDYTMQVGYATGDEYPNTGRTLTHRCLYWTSASDVTLVAMTARAQAPAAVSAVRIYRVKDGALPAAAMHEPVARRPPSGARRFWGDLTSGRVADLKFSQPSAATNAPTRSVALYFEDPAIGYDFGVPKSNGFLPDDLDDLIDRTVALMKFTGEDTFAYPGAWYHGLIGEKYNPRHHAPDFLSAWYAKFDREGLGLYPTINMNTMPVPDGLVTRASMSDGSLHDSVIAIHDTGRPNWGGWHDTPPNFNIQNKAVRRHISGIISALVDQGAGHPSFKGVCLHLTRHCMLWFGDEQSGYNDYTVAAFAKAKGLKIPVKKSDPLRGKAYAEWIRAHAWEEWIQWRCDVVTDFYVQEAQKLAARRPDLKLWINSFVPANIHHPDFMKPDYMEQANRACGLDRDALTKRAPNVILCQTLVPADYRWRSAEAYPTPEARSHQRVLDTLPGFYSLLRGASYPWVNQHDRYWESPIGRGGAKNAANSLSCDWLKECAWRVSTINPSGDSALRHFVLPLRYGDVLGLSKGGFLIGTYGMEERLVPFFQAFRALPAVVFKDVGAAASDNVRVRHADWDGRSWFYVVNTDLKPVTVKLEVPAKTVDLVTGERVGGLFGPETLTLNLGPYEMRSYQAPEGTPVRH